MKRDVAILVVCTGNICRSPTGEGVLRELARRRGIGSALRVASAGTHDYHVGESPDPRAVKHAARRGYDLAGLRASQLQAADFRAYDHILAMDHGHLRILQASARHDSTASLALFLEASARWKDEDIPDPYYGDAADFERVLDMVEEGAGRWLDRIVARE